MPTLDPILTTTAQFCVALLFLSAVTAKVSNFAVFRATLAEYELVPQGLVGTAASLFAAAELMVGIAALIPGSARAAMAGGALLLSLYAVAIAINLARGRRDIDCGCTGPATRQLLSGWLLVRNGALVVLALAGTAVPGARSMAIADWVVVALAVSGAVALYAAVNQLMANAPRLDALDALMESS